MDYSSAIQLGQLDLSPFQSNILVDGNGIARLCDFGQSNIVEANVTWQRSMPTIGVVRWIAPELITGDPTTSSDMYSLGMCYLVSNVASDFATPPHRPS